MNSFDGIAQNWNFARDFPEALPEHILRPHLLETIAEILGADTPVVFLEGEEGDGATTTLAQFCRAYPEHTFALFIRPASRFAYSPDYLRLALAEQMHWYVYGTTLNRENFDESEFDRLVLKIQGKQRSATLYFVVDGLHQVPTEEQRIVEQILSEVLPIGVGQCRFLITGQQSILAPKVKGGVKSKPYQQLRFKPEESRLYLAETGVGEEEASALHQLCKGVPGRLAVVRRLLLSGTTLESILDSHPSRYPEFLKLEFAPLEKFDESQQLILATLAFSKMALTVEEVSAILGLTGDEVGRTVSLSPFLQSNSISGSVEFISESHRRIAEKQLERCRKQALSAQLAHLLKNPSSEVSLRFLPTYFETLNHQEAILSLLSKEHYSDLLASTQSFTALKNRAAIGARNAEALRRTHEVFKFALQRSIFISAGELEASRSQIEALVVLGKAGAALALANRAAAKEDRLALLAAYARRVKETAGHVEPEVANFVKKLIGEIDCGELGSRAIDIAANVLIFDPDSALGMIEAAVKASSAAAKDAAYMQLSLAASMSKLKHKTAVEDKARPKISSESMHQLAKSFEILAETLDPVELVDLVSQMPAAHQVYFLGTIVQLRKRDLRILKIVEFGLDVIIRESEYVPRSRDLASLASPLAFKTGDGETLKRLVARFDSQLGLVAKTAYSKDLTVLQMRLASAELQYDSSSARDRIEQAYFEILDVKTPEVQLECYALMLASLNELDADGNLEKRDGFRALVRTEMAELLSRVLSDTGDHLAAVTPVLKAIAADDPKQALELAARLNTEERRDTAYARVARVIAAGPYGDLALGSLVEALNRIESTSACSIAVSSLLGVLEANPDRAQWAKHLERFRDLVLDPRALCEWDIWIWRQADANSTFTFPIGLFEDRMAASIDRLDSDLDEVDIRFKIAQVLATSEVARARTYYEQAEKLRHSLPISSDSGAELFELCLALLSRVMAPLGRAAMLNDDTLQRHATLVAQLPGSIRQVNAYSDLAERLWCAKRVDLAASIAQEKLRPLLEQAKIRDLNSYRDAVATSHPIFSVLHLGSALDMVEILEPQEADSALYSAARLRLRKLGSSEPDASGPGDRSRLEASDVIDIIEILRHVREDAALFSILHVLVEGIRDKANRSRFTAQQKADWATKCRAIIEAKLPDSRNIQHRGFEIVCLALTYSLEDVHFSRWESLETLAEAIANVADRGYVFQCLAVSIPSKHATHRKRYFQRTIELFELIPSQIDRLSHFQDYAQQAYQHDAVASAREILKRAMILSMEVEDNSKSAHHRRQLIDLADQIEPALADELIELVDDDPAREHLKADAKRAAALAKAKREMGNAKMGNDALKCEIEMLPGAAWKNLAELGAGRLEIKSLDVMTEYISRVADSSLHEAFPVLSWHLENLGRKFKSQQDITEHLLPACEALLLSTEIAQMVASFASRAASVEEDEVNNGLLVRRHKRPDAVAFIADWLQSNAVNYIKYCDAYFSPADLPLLRLILAHAPLCKVVIVASKGHLIKEAALSDEVFLAAWRASCSQDPPETEIIAVAFADSPRHVIHDRWLLTDGGGLRLGTSFNSLGVEKVSEVSEIDRARADVIEQQIDRYVAKERFIDGARMTYSSFTL